MRFFFVGYINRRINPCCLVSNKGAIARELQIRYANYSSADTRLYLHSLQVSREMCTVFITKSKLVYILNL